jgi:hypothetical protein
LKKNTKKLLLLSIMPITITGVLLSTQLGSANEKLDIRVESTNNSVDVSFNSVGNTIKVFKDEKIYKQLNVQTGLFKASKKNDVQLSNLGSDTPQRLKIKAYDGDKIVDEAVIETSTLRSEEDKKQYKDNPLKDSNLITIIRKNEVKLSWSGVPDDDQTYEVYRDKKIIGEVKGTEYVDNSVTANKKYIYEIIGKTKISEQEKKRKKAKLKQMKVPITKKDEENLYYVSNTLTKEVTTNGDYTVKSNKQKTISTSSASNTILGYGHLLRYQIFIPAVKVLNPSLSAYKWPKFTGDTRTGYDWFSNRYRTRADVYILFDKSKIIIKKDANYTVAYDWFGNVAYKKKANLSNVRLTARSFGSDSGGRYAKVGLTHSVFDPLVEPISGAPAVDYYYNAKVYENGAVTALGQHDQAPSHELWMIAYPGDADTKIHTYPNQGLHKLISVYPSVNWSYAP